MIDLIAHRRPLTPWRGSVLSDALKGVLIGGVPRIEVLAESTTEGCNGSGLIALVRDLKWASLSTQNVRGWRMDLAMNDDIVRLWRNSHAASPKAACGMLKKQVWVNTRRKESLAGALDRQLFTIAQALLNGTCTQSRTRRLRLQPSWWESRTSASDDASR